MTARSSIDFERIPLAALAERFSASSTSSAGLPLGMRVAGSFAAETTLFRLAEQFGRVN